MQESAFALESIRRLSSWTLQGPLALAQRLIMAAELSWSNGRCSLAAWVFAEAVAVEGHIALQVPRRLTAGSASSQLAFEHIVLKALFWKHRERCCLDVFTCEMEGDNTRNGMQLRALKAGPASRCLSRVQHCGRAPLDYLG